MSPTLNTVSYFSIRLLPHHQDTGAFFVALFQKIDKTTDSLSSTQEETSQKRPAEENTFNEDGYTDCQITLILLIFSLELILNVLDIIVKIRLFSSEKKI
jgi:hypothetical protein